MNIPFNTAIESVIDMLPENEKEASELISGFSPRENETLSGITGYLEDFGIRVQGIFFDNGLDYTADDSNTAEFRHMLKNLGARVNQSENSLNRNGARTYYWIDIFRSNIKQLIVL